jgi:hypothetical protein
MLLYQINFETERCHSSQNLYENVEKCLVLPEQGGDTFSICCNYVIVTLICNYNLTCAMNMSLSFGLRDFWGIL